MSEEFLKFSRLAKFSILASLFLFGACSPNQKSQTELIQISPDFNSLSISQSAANWTGPIGRDTDFQDLLQVYVQNSDNGITKDQLPIVGSYVYENKTLTYKPSFKFVAGKSYLVKVLKDGKWMEKSFSIPRNDLTPTTEVAQVYPSSEKLPRNLLKFYIQFSDSMAARYAYENITLLNANQDTIKDAFLELEEELWSSDMKRFTLLFDPGRIKRGLGSQDDMGYTFSVGQHYSLSIHANWLDAQGRILKKEFKKEFIITDDDREKPNPNSWSFEYPRASTEDPLSILFNEPLDYALAQRVIAIIDPDGRSVDGHLSIDQNETEWIFSPSQHWVKGDYELRIETILEDRSGNNMKNVFDVDNQKEQTDLSVDRYKIIPFRIEEH